MLLSAKFPSINPIARMFRYDVLGLEITFTCVYFAIIFTIKYELTSATMVRPALSFYVIAKMNCVKNTTLLYIL